MALSRCNVFNREDQRCGLTAKHPGQDHSFGPIPPGPRRAPPRRDLGERYIDEQQDVVIDAQDVLAGWVSPHRQITCTCADTPPTMPTYRDQHLESCPLAPLQALLAENKQLKRELHTAKTGASIYRDERDRLRHALVARGGLDHLAQCPSCLAERTNGERHEEDCPLILLVDSIRRG